MNSQWYYSNSCGDGKHTWIYDSNTTDTNVEPEPSLRCVCGALRWDERHLTSVAPDAKSGAGELEQYTGRIMDLIGMIKEYYQIRNLVWPNTHESILWVLSELGEASEVLLSGGDWVRNNPADHPKKTKEDLAEEIGDIIMMLLVLGINQEVDPIQALKEKLGKYVEREET